MRKLRHRVCSLSSSAIVVSMEKLRECCLLSSLLMTAIIARYEKKFGGLAMDESEGDRIASSLLQEDSGKPALVLFLANHGVVVIGPSVAMAFGK